MPILSTYILPHPPVLLPEIGQERSRELEVTTNAYMKAAKMVADDSPDTIIVITPHSVAYSDYIHISPGARASGDFSAFGCKELSFDAVYDAEFVSRVTDIGTGMKLYCGVSGERAAGLDHGTLVPLYFVNKFYTGYKLVRISISGLYRGYLYAFGKAIKQAVDELGRKTVIIASGDLSHKLTHTGPYGFSAQGPVFDRQVTDAMKNADFLRFMTTEAELCEEAAECGLRSFVIMSGALDRTDVKAEFLSYEGPFGVGYGICAYKPLGQNEDRNFGEQLEAQNRAKISRIRKNQSKYACLAQKTLESYLKKGGDADIHEEDMDDGMYEKAGVFVCLKKHGELRGCIGTILPVRRNVADEIVTNTISAATQDGRFDPVTEDELDDITYTVDVLTLPEKCVYEDLDPDIYGVIITSGQKRGVLLPDLEGIDTRDKQLSTVLKKAGIGKKEAYSLERFSVKRFA